MDRASTAIRVAIVNDFPLVVEGLAKLVAPDRRFTVVELDVQSEPLRPVDIVLFDAFHQQDRLPVDIGRLVAQQGSARVVVFSWNVDATLVAESMDRGACGYLSKRRTREELTDALARIHAGERIVDVVPPSDAEVEGDWPGRAEGLTAREAEIVTLIAAGETNEAIARRCYLSINSVKTHIRNAYRKMGVERRAQAVRWALERGMMPPAPQRAEPRLPPAER